MAIHFSGVYVTSTSIDFYIKSDPGSGEVWSSCYLYLGGDHGPTGGVLQAQEFHVTDGNDVIVRFTGLTPNTGYYGIVTSLSLYCWAKTSSGGGTSGGGSSSGSWSGGSQTKTNTASWTPSTTAGTCAYNTADSCWSYGTVSLISSDSSWYGYSWAYACLTSVVETDYDVTYRITQGARTKNIAD